MKEDPDSTLLSVAEALADGMPVDWQGLCEREPALEERVARLRSLADVAEAYRELRKATDTAASPED